MRIFGLDITKALNPVSSRYSSFWGWLHDQFPGAWQQNVEVDYASILRFPAVFACVTLISGDIGKLRLTLKQRDPSGTWVEIRDPVNPVFVYPNGYQTRVQFIQQWVLSELLHGNTYIFMERNSPGQVIALHVLDPCRVKVLVSDMGDVFYQLDQDDLAGLENSKLAVPASEIIHDRFNCLHHPLVGISPLSAAGLAATLGQAILGNSSQFFSNGSRPGGVLSAPGAISNDTAQRLKAYWDSNFTGANAGKIAVLGDGLKYEQMSITAEDSQLLEQLKLADELVAMVFHVPAYKIGAGTIPTYQNAAVLNQIYYSDCLQVLIENIEASLDKGLGHGPGLGVEFDLDDLLRMDAQTQVQTLAAAVGGAIMAPNEARRKMNLKPLQGGDTVYLQQQNFSLEALDERDQTNPLAAPAAPSVEAAYGTRLPIIYGERRDEQQLLPAPDETLAAAIEKHWEAQIAA